MATAYISEYENLSQTGAQITVEPPIASQTVSFTTTTQSSAFNAKTRYIGFTADAAFHFLVGSNPTATTSTMKRPANEMYFCGVEGGHKIAFVTGA